MSPLNCPIDEYKRIKMKFNVTKIKFDFDKLFDVHMTLIESRMYDQVYQGA